MNLLATCTLQSATRQRPHAHLSTMSYPPLIYPPTSADIAWTGTLLDETYQQITKISGAATDHDEISEVIGVSLLSCKPT
ncbi:hypothetical protein PILCRDRAFT_414075 [Piloderma croceum F 1598]|uniref:Uncharacterized protein n=1 Tax=Piloderma croceum (strain F 1598) TaxID=765440 RepID=A0A0C3FW62_PILCF|nr:hypothetical protein PILCRDRAFT_414075 [Piloderma croceum F 1598]